MSPLCGAKAVAGGKPGRRESDEGGGKNAIVVRGVVMVLNAFGIVASLEARLPQHGSRIIDRGLAR